MTDLFAAERMDWIEEWIGRLVVVAHWSDFQLEDETRLGILRGVRSGYFYIDGSERGYRHCRVVGDNL